LAEVCECFWLMIGSDNLLSIKLSAASTVVLLVPMCCSCMFCCSLLTFSRVTRGTLKLCNHDDCDDDDGDDKV